MPIKFHSILISDVHFGSPLCQARELHDFLGNIRVKNLILNGDIFEDLKFYRLSHWHWEAFGQIRKISDHCKVVWIRGNHDVVDPEFMGHLLGVKVKGHFEWNVGNRRCYATHGDRWDVYIYKYRRASEALTAGYNFLRRFSSRGMRALARFLKTRSKMLLRNHEALLYSASSFGRSHGMDAVFCGHTHRASLETAEGLLYGNSGTWESDLPHFIGVNPDGVFLCRYLRGDAFEVVKSLNFIDKKQGSLVFPELTLPSPKGNLAPAK
ncbi:MAG: UDP-2,3-diacylglucosamine diphosphatase [candidate division FCPU426 bacterium]